MKYITTTILFILINLGPLVLLGQEQNPYDLILEANAATKASQYDIAEKKYLTALDLLQVLKTESRTAFFLENIEKGIAAKRQNAFLEAMDYFEVAGQSSRVSYRKDEAGVYKSLTIIAIGRSLEEAAKLMDEAANNKASAEIQYKTRRFMDLARASVTELNLGNTLNALHLAHLSNQQLDELSVKSSQKPPFINALFGNATYAYYGQKWNQLGSPVRSANFFGEDHQSFIVVTDEPSPIIFKGSGQQSTLSPTFNGLIQFADLSDDSRSPIFLSGSTDRQLRLTNLVPPYESITLQESKQRLRNALFSPDQQLILSFGKNKEAVLWRLPFQKEEFTALKDHQSEIVGASFSPDSKTIATWDENGMIYLWSVSGVLIQSFQAFEESTILGIEFSHNSRSFLAWATNNKLKVWNGSGELQYALNAHTNDLLHATFSPDDKTILSCSADSTAILWDLAADRHQRMEEHENRVCGGLFTPDGQSIITYDINGKVNIWNTNGDLQSSFNQHNGPLTSISLSKDGKHILSASIDKTAKLWDLAGQVHMNMDDFDGIVNVAHFSSDGYYVLIGTEDASVVWCPTPEKAKMMMDELPPLSSELQKQFEIE